MIVDSVFSLSENEFRLELFETITTGIKISHVQEDNAVHYSLLKSPYRRFVGQSGDFALIARWTGEYPVCL